MKNADVETGKHYAWSKYEPRGSDLLAKVEALDPAPTTGRRSITGRRIRFTEDYEPRWGVIIPAETIRTVPARELRGPWDEYAEKQETERRLRAEADRVANLVDDALEAHGLIDPDGIRRIRVQASPSMGDVRLTITVYTAERVEALVAALSSDG